MENKRKPVSAFEPNIIITGVILAVLSAVICMQLIGNVGVTPNTSLIGAIFAMILARVPLSQLSSYKSMERQNMLQTIVSGAGFAAANCGFIAVGILWGLEKVEYILPMAIGCILGTTISIITVGKLFDSPLFPAQGAWPPGVATASAIQAGDEGGKKGRRLIEGLVLGVIGSYFKLPVAGIGIVFIANIFSMAGLGVGLVLRGYSKQIFSLFGMVDFNLGATKIPQGIMIGAGIVALLQSLYIIFKNRKNDEQLTNSVTVSSKDSKKSLVYGFGGLIAASIVTAVITGIFSDMSVSEMAVWVLWCAFSSLVAMLLVGMAAMHSGWFPAFAISTIFMTVAILLGFKPLAIAVMTGFIGSVGPCFADMGYDLKAGWILRGKSEDKEYEKYGRKQQVIIEAIGGIIGILVVLLFSKALMSQNVIPPISKVFATTITAGADPAALKEMLMWAIPGAFIQFIFGKKMVGVLFATGLLLNSPIYGIGVLIAVTVRLIFGSEFMEVRDAGLIAADGLFGFVTNLIKVFF
ncbi:OPT/YSL family transporter [Fusobacterium sp.]|uniref:OPT/YSL family transporter n=1 Tax=Fusobacterium sp. TaxID=68766 RepID=UPI002902505E|nr:OPT/YSL family transporter [Fusobacterium sp.]MDU1910965.1 OPT/YSL family transporter [Fusobacterium sp.]